MSSSDTFIIERIEGFGVDYDRLNEALGQTDNWGSMVHSFEYLTVLGVVKDAMRKRQEEKGASQ